MTITDADSAQTCSASVATGSCQIAFAAAGTHNLTATYGGDANFNGSASTPATVHVVNKAATTTAITGDSPDPSVVDQTYTVTWTVTVNGPGAGSPTGTVAVDDGAGNTCSAAVAAGTCDLASTSAGAKTLTATYGGDSNFLTSADTESHTVNTRASSTSVDCQPGSIVVDQPTTCTVTVTDIDGLGTKSDPSGTVTFSSSETGTFDFTTCALVGNGDDTSDCSVVYTPTAKGTGLHVIGASYGGSTVHSASFDIDGVTVTVDHRATSTTVECDSPVVVGQGSTCTATVDDIAGSGTPSAPAGTVDFLGEGPGGFDTTSCILASVDGDTSACSVIYTPTAVGDGAHTIAAAYTHSGDVHGNSSDADGFDITVDPADTTTAITSDDNDPSVVGEIYTVTWTVTVDSPGAGTPTGTVTVDDGDGNTCSAAVADGTCDLASTSAGAKTLTATYGGDADFNGSADTEAHQVNAADTTTTITTDLPDPSVVGQPVTITYSVSVNAPGAGSPTGTVTITDADSAQTCSASVATGSCQIAFAAAGTHNLTATYGGDANFNGSASTPATVHVVNKAATTTAITGDSPDPSVVDQTYTVTWTVTVNGPGAGSPTGTVTVDDGAGNTCSAAVAAGTCDLASTSAGAKTLTATYGGDSNFLTSADTESHTVNTRASSTSVDCQPGSIVVDQPTTCTVTVTDIDGLGTKSDPSGTVTFSSSETGTFDFTTCALVGNGDDTSDCSVVYTPTAKGTGLHVIGASYGGSTVHSASFDIDGVTVTVDHRATSTTVECDSPVVVGQGSTCTATVDDIAGSGTPSAPAGTVDFLGEGPGGFDTTSCILASVDGDTSACSVIYTPTAVGDGAHTIAAAYTHSGDVHGDSSDADGFDITVDPADTTTAITSDDNDPSVVGEVYTVTWTVTVDSPGAGTPTGTVTVDDGDGNTCSAAVADGTCDLASTSAGAKTLTATYGGDADFNGSADTEAHQVNAADTTTTITTDLPDPSVVGQPVTITYSVSVNAPGAGSPTGTVRSPTPTAPRPARPAWPPGRARSPSRRPAPTT